MRVFLRIWAMRCAHLDCGAPTWTVSWLGADGEACRPVAEVAGVGFEAVAAVRGFPSYRGQRRFPGWYWSATAGWLVAYESRL